MSIVVEHHETKIDVAIYVLEYEVLRSRVPRLDAFLIMCDNPNPQPIAGQNRLYNTIPRTYPSVTVVNRYDSHIFTKTHMRGTYLLSAFYSHYVLQSPNNPQMRSPGSRPRRLCLSRCILRRITAAPWTLKSAHQCGRAEAMRIVGGEVMQVHRCGS